MAPLINPRTLALLARLAERAMQDTCVIVTPGQPVSDSGGESAPAAPTEGQCICAWFAPRGDEASDAVIQVRGQHRMSVPRTTVIDERCQVRFNGRLYPVVWSPLPTALDVERIIGLAELR